MIIDDDIDFRTSLKIDDSLFKLSIENDDMVVTILDDRYYGFKFNFIDMVEINGVMRYNIHVRDFGKDVDGVNFTITDVLQSMIDRVFFYILVDYVDLVNTGV